MRITGMQTPLRFQEHTMKYFMMIALALGLGACDGNDNGGGEDGNVNTACTDNCDDTDTPTGWAEYTVFVYDGFGAELDTALVFASTKTNIYDATSGETMSLPAPETYTVKAGSPADGTTSDGLPIIVGSDGWRWVSPSWNAPLKDGDKLEDPIDSNAFADGSWTCEFNNGFPDTPGEVTYDDGEYLYLPGVGMDIVVSGMTLHREGDDFTQEGEFTSPTEIVVNSYGGMAGDYTANCYAD